MAKYANLAMVIVLISVYGLAFRALKEVGKATSFVATPHTPQAFFLFCGNCFYSFEGVATIVPLIAAMEDQTAVPRVLGTALAVILALQVGKEEYHMRQKSSLHQSKSGFSHCSPPQRLFVH
jgi:amino acid permease